MAVARDVALNQLRVALLFKRRWAYLRYLHARQAVMLIDPASSVLVVGGGSGFAEVALALEFPRMTFHVTDYGGATHNLDKARKFVEAFGMANLGFGQLDILAPQGAAKYDTVYSVEVLEHIKDDEAAAANMCELARRHVFCLVPFADDITNADPVVRARQLERHEHHVAGFDVKRLVQLFPNPVAMRGAYWSDGGRYLRDRLTNMDADEMRTGMSELQALAERDLRPLLPVHPKEAAGIWTLARVHGR